MVTQLLTNRLGLGTILACCTILTGCMAPPPTKTIARTVDLDRHHCAAPVQPMTVVRNDKVSWSLNSKSQGYLGTEAFSIDFQDKNPTYCVSEVKVRKTDSVTCTIKADAQPQTLTYAVVTFYEGGTLYCSQSFVLNIVADG